MLMSKGLFKRVVAGFMSLVMIFTIMPYSGTPALAAEADSGTVYATNPTWYELDKDSDEDAMMETLGILLSYQKDNPEANRLNGIHQNFDDLRFFDQYYVGDTMYIKLKHDIDVKFSPRNWYSMSKPSLQDKTANWKYNLPVYGKKVLDLNGHKIKVQQQN